MRRITLIYGLIGGCSVVLLWHLTKPLWEPDMNFALGEILGYIGMIVSLVTIFLGIKSLRDKQLGGVISFKQGFVQGLYITLVASLIYVLGWEIYYNTVGGEFMDQYTEYMITEAEAAGTPQEEIDLQLEEMAQMEELYAIAPVRWGFTLLEILPVALIITIISALFLSKKNPKTATS